MPKLGFYKFIEAHDFSIAYHLEKANIVVDALSRNPQGQIS